MWSKCKHYPHISAAALALRTASDITLEFQALSSRTSTQVLRGLETVCGLSLNPGGTCRSEATWWKLMNLALPLSPRTASAPALGLLQEGSSRGTSSREGARAAQCCALPLKLGPGPSPVPALYCPESKRLMIRSSVENGLERSKTPVIIATGESCCACVSVRALHRSAVGRRNDAVSDGCPETVCVCCAARITDVHRDSVTYRLRVAPLTPPENKPPIGDLNILLQQQCWEDYFANVIG